MADEEGEVATEGDQESGGPKGESKEKSGTAGKKSGKESKKKWEEKVAEENQKKKDEIMPWGSDPCVTIRLKLGKLPEKDISAVKGSTFPWYEPRRKLDDLRKEEEEVEEKKKKKKKDDQGDKTTDDAVQKNLERIQSLSEEVRKRRIFECNRKRGDTETYEQYCARKERVERKRQKRKRDEKEEENEGEEWGEFQEKEEGKDKKVDKRDPNKDGEQDVEESDEFEEMKKRGKMKRDVEEIDVSYDSKTKVRKEAEKYQTDNEKKEGDKKKRKDDIKKDWPSSYPATVTEDFITMLKMIIEAEFETKPPEKKRKKRQPKRSKKDKILTEFTSFLNVLFTANEMMKKKDRDEEEERHTGSVRKESGSKRKSDEEKETELNSTMYSVDEDKAENVELVEDETSNEPPEK